MVDGLEDEFSHFLGSGLLETDLHLLESICKALDTNADGSVSHVGVLCLLHWVVVPVYDLVQVLGHSAGDIMQFLIHELLGLLVDESGQCNGCQVADGHLIRTGVLNDLSAQVGALDGAQVLLVALPVAGILVQHVGSACLDLTLNDLGPQPLGLDGLPASAFSLILLIQGFKLFSPGLIQSWAFIGTHQCPVSVGLHTFHEEIRYPQSIEQVTGSVLLLAMVLPQLQELIDVCVPGLQVYSEGSLSLSTSLVNVSGCVIEHPQHGHKSIRIAVGSSDIGVSGSDAVHGKSNASSKLRDDGSLFECVIDPLNGVLFHGEQKA